MKKILALALAFVMVMGLASVAFAANDPEFVFHVLATGGPDNDGIYNKGSKDEYKIADGRYVAAEDEDGLLGALSTVERGDTIYVMLTTEGGDMDAKTANKWKVKADWKVGGDMVDSVEIEYKKFAGSKQYDYVVAIKTNAKTSTSLEDLVGVLSLYTTSPSSAEAAEDRKVMFAVAGNAYATYGIDDVDLMDARIDGVIVPNSEYPVVSFDDLDEEVITFEGVGEFEINLYKQGKLYLGFNTDFNKEIADKYPEAELEFVNFVGKPAFNKWGVFYLYADEDNKYVYEMRDGVISKVEATWDESMDAYRFAAKRFDTFITSDVELDLSAQGTTEGGDKPNPGTGR